MAICDTITPDAVNQYIAHRIPNDRKHCIVEPLEEA